MSRADTGAGGRGAGGSRGGAPVDGERLPELPRPAALLGGGRPREGGAARSREAGEARQHGQEEHDGTPHRIVSGVPTGMSRPSRRMSGLRRRMQPWETLPGTRSGRSVPWIPTTPPPGQSLTEA